MQNAVIRDAEIKAAIALDGLAGALAAFTAQLLSEKKLCDEQPTFTFAPAKSMHDAALIAVQRSKAWRLDGDDELIDNTGNLFYISDMQDMRLRLSLSDDRSYYLVAEDGSIGLTTDGCANIDWIFHAAIPEEQEPFQLQTDFD